MSFADILKSLERTGEQKLAAKLPSWAGVPLEVPASLNFQQCSSEVTARYKASLVPEGARVADLTGGLGADSWAFSMRSSAVWYNERDSVLLEAVKKNFAALGVSNVVSNGFDITLAEAGWQDALRAFRPDIIYLDPARRDAAGKKVFLLEDCSPDVVSLMPVLLDIAPMVMLKVSPMADITMLRRRLSGWLSELHVVGSEGECKELLCLCRRDAQFRGVTLAEDGYVMPDSVVTEAGVASEDRLRPRSREWEGPEGVRWAEESLLSDGQRIPVGGMSPEGAKSFGGNSSEVETESGKTEELLFVPSAAMVKSGLGPGMCLMEYDEQLAHFGKFWQIIENLPFSSSEIKALGRRYPQADVTARGVPVSSEQLLRRLRVAARRPHPHLRLLPLRRPPPLSLPPRESPGE